MRVSFATGIRTLPYDPEPIVDQYRKFLELGRLAEDLGFHRVWLSEHHFAEDDWNPSALIALGALATHTSRIRLGTYVTLIAMHHPIRLAEDTATVDILSDGRFDFAFGAGGQPLEYQTFGIDPKESFGRAYEALEVLEKCWTEEVFSHDGKYFHFDEVRMRPKPVQSRIPIYAAAMGPQSQRRSAQRGYHLASALHSPTWRDYEGLTLAQGRSQESLDVVSGPIFLHLADTRDQAWDECEVGVQWCLDFYARRGQPMDVPPVGEFRKRGLAYGQPIPVGSVDDVLETLSPLEDQPLDELCFQFDFPGMPHEQAVRSMQTFAREVKPVIESWGHPRLARTEVTEVAAGEA